jgi:hypothetical protein
MRRFFDRFSRGDAAILPVLLAAAAPAPVVIGYKRFRANF